MYERQPTKPSTSDCNLRDTARDLSDEHKTNYSNNRNHSRPRARDCSSDKRYRDPNKAGSSDQTVYRDYRSRDPSRGSSRDSLDQTCDDNRRRSCAGSKPILQRQGTFTELRKSRPQSVEFSQSPSPRPGRPLSGPPLVSSQSQDSDVTAGGARRKTASFSRQVSETSSGKQTRLQVNPAVQERQEQARPTHSGCFSRSSPSPTFARKYRGSPGRGRMI